MGDSDKAAIASFVMRGKEYLAAVRADGDLLALETLFFADEVREPHQQISNLPGRVKLTRQELRMARQLIESMTGPWQPSDYRDTYTDRVNDLIKAKKNNEELQPAAEAPPGTTVMDLSEALRASVEAAKRTAGGKRGGRRGTAKQKAPTKKKAGKRPARKRAA
jgi:DNA end-binding protein Ku